MPPRRKGDVGGPLAMRGGRIGGRCRCRGPRGRSAAGEVAGGDAAQLQRRSCGRRRCTGTQGRSRVKEMAGSGTAAVLGRGDRGRRSNVLTLLHLTHCQYSATQGDTEISTYGHQTFKRVCAPEQRPFIYTCRYMHDESERSRPG